MKQLYFYVYNFMVIIKQIISEGIQSFKAPILLMNNDFLE